MSAFIDLNGVFTKLNINAYDENTMNFIINSIVNKVDGNPNVNENKQKQFKNLMSEMSSQGSVNPIDMSNISNVSSSDLALLAVSYYLSNLNKYDYHLINYCDTIDMTVSDVIILLLLNDIYSIEQFCNTKSCKTDCKNMIITLKRLSALHKVEFDF